jgi:alcohol dehydrogenase (nicotinoprotein)
VRTQAAVMHGHGQEWEITELELDPPKAGEVLVKMVASGLCHTDDHIRTGDLVPRFPLVGGHEGAGLVEQVGEGVTALAPGDHIVCSFLPVCGRCRFCAMGRTNLCDMGATLIEGCLPDGTFRWHRDGEDFSGFCMLGTFSQFAVLSQSSCVKVNPELPLEVAVLLSCGVTTGWGSAVHAGQVGPGDTVVVYGVGGVGVNAVQGARHAGATQIVAVDPLENKREFALTMGATQAVASAEEAAELLSEITGGVLADVAIITTALVDAPVIESGFDAIRKGGTLVITGLAPPQEKTIQLPASVLTLWEKRVQGAIFGSGNPFIDIPDLARMYQLGHLKLDELITRRYALDEINRGYSDLLDGHNIRGVIIHDH